MKLVRAALILFFAAPGAALASPALVARDLPTTSGAVAQASEPFSLVGLHWRGNGAIRFRTQDGQGRWSGWHVAVPEGDDLPDRNTDEARRSRGWHLGNPFWVGSASRIQYRFSGPVSRLRAFFVRSPQLPRTPPPMETFQTAQPTVITRAQWGADERIRRKDPRIADGVHFAIVHHTAGSNNYSRSQSAAIVRAIEIYHVKGNGWDDIGYNFLVDKYGQVFEGRWGGMEKAVVGAHAMGFNLGSVGVALIGNYTGIGFTPAERASLIRVLAWRLDVAHVDPLSRVTRVSTGNPEYRQGQSVQLRAIAGHRDTYPTSCPGANVYAQLPAITRAVAATGLPKIYSPIVFGAIGGKVRFTARLSSSVPWTVTVDDAFGKVVATGTGVGRSLDWTWDATLATRGRYTYTIAAGGAGASAARPVTGAIGQSLPQLSLTALKVTPSVVTPNGDGLGDTARISYTLGATASLTVTLGDAAGAPVASLFSGPQTAGAHSIAWNQIDIPDGRYTLSVAATSAAGKVVSSTKTFYVDRTLVGPRLDTLLLSPNGDGRFERATLSFSLTAPASATVELRRNGKVLATLLDQVLGAGAQQVPWDGRVAGQVVRDGSYELAVKAIDTLTTVEQALPLTVDVTPPRLRLLARAKLRFSSSEAAIVTARFDGRRIVKRVRRGSFSFPRARARHFTLSAVDAAGNKSRTLTG